MSKEDLITSEGVVEEVNCRPTATSSNFVGREHLVEVIRAVDVTEVAAIVVVLRRTCVTEGVVAAHRVTDDLHDGAQIIVIEL